MAGKPIYSICGMCTVRCPIQVDVAGDQVKFIQGNPHAAGLEGALCARGGAGGALINDSERPQTPLIRVGARGEGVSDGALMPGGLGRWDKAGGAMAMQEHFVTVRKLEQE